MSLDPINVQLFKICLKDEFYFLVFSEMKAVKHLSLLVNSKNSFKKSKLVNLISATSTDEKYFFVF